MRRRIRQPPGAARGPAVDATDPSILRDPVWISSSSPATAALPPKSALARLVHEGAALDGGLAQAAAASRFTGSKGQTLDVLAPAGMDAARLVLVGSASRRRGRDRDRAWRGARLRRRLASGLTGLRIELPAATADLAAHAALGGAVGELPVRQVPDQGAGRKEALGGEDPGRR